MALALSRRTTGPETAVGNICRGTARRNPGETTPLLPTFHRIVSKAIFPVLSGGGYHAGRSLLAKAVLEAN